MIVILQKMDGNRMRPNLPPLLINQPNGSLNYPQMQRFPTPPQQAPTNQQMPAYVETAEQSKLRFEIESEFVQSLANPHYLNFLSQKGFFKEATFVRYLAYLRYWKQPEYAKTMKYPQALLFLDLLQKAEFREAIANTNNAKFIEDQMLLQWHYYLRKRQRIAQCQDTFGEDASDMTLSPDAPATETQSPEDYTVEGS